MNTLKWAFKDINAAYEKSLELHLETKCAEISKSNHIHTLDLQLMGPLLQYDHAWSQRKKDVDGCPCCLHVSTMVVKLQVDVNAKNLKLHTKALAGGGDGKFVTISALHGCYCSLNNCRGHERGYGCFECVRKAADGEASVDHGPGVCGFDCVVCDCDCWCVFMEHNRQKIATEVKRE
jgi:hypothetical protein